MADNARDKFWRKAIGEARTRLRFLPERQLEKQLDYAAGTLAEAYRIGAEEAQGEILARLLALQQKLMAPAPRPKHLEPWEDGTPTTVDYDNDCAP